MWPALNRHVIFANHQNGFSLVGLLVGSAFLGVIAFSASRIMNSSNVAVGHSQRKQIAEVARAQAQNIANLAASSNSNAALRNCMLARNCSTGWEPFDLRSSNGNSIVAGTNVFFDQRTLTRCTAGAPNCVLSLQAEYRASGNRIETRILMRNVADPSWNGIETSSATVELSSVSNPRVCRIPHSSLIGVNADGTLSCSPNSLPAGPGPVCGGSAAVRSIGVNGDSACVNAVVSVDTTNNPSGFFVRSADGTYRWGDCRAITGLNELFPNTNTRFSCDWESQAPCTKTHGYLQPRTCTSTSCSGSPAVCTTTTRDCSYCVTTGTSYPTCTQTSGATRSGGPGGFRCGEIIPGNNSCNNLTSTRCEPLDCPAKRLVSHSGSAQCRR